MIKPPPNRACVIGWPIEHSRSPLIHNYWLRTLGIAGHYDRQAIRAPELPAFFAQIGSDGLAGANVTAPHKEAAFAACDWLGRNARATGAVNTLWREGGRLCGDNSDVSGFAENLDELAPGWARPGASAMVLGAGGAARAIVYALRQRGFDAIHIVNRSAERAQALAAHFGAGATARGWSEMAPSMGDVDLLVNTTQLGMAGQPALDFDVAKLRASAVVADIIYAPLRTPLVKGAEARGLRAVGGLGMLLHQAKLGFERWFGQRPAVTQELRALLEADIQAKAAP